MLHHMGAGENKNESQISFMHGHTVGWGGLPTETRPKPTRHTDYFLEVQTDVKSDFLGLVFLLVGLI